MGLVKGEGGEIRNNYNPNHHINRRFFLGGAASVAYGSSPDQGLNLSCSCDLCHNCGNAGSLTYCATAKTPV